MRYLVTPACIADEALYWPKRVLCDHTSLLFALTGRCGSLIGHACNIYTLVPRPSSSFHCGTGPGYKGICCMHEQWATYSETLAHRTSSGRAAISNIADC